MTSNNAVAIGLSKIKAYYHNNTQSWVKSDWVDHIASQMSKKKKKTCLKSIQTIQTET